MQRQVPSAKIPRFVSSRTPEIYKKVTTALEIATAPDCSDVKLTWTCKQANNFAPNEYRGVVNSSGLVVYKGSNARDKKVLNESKSRK